MRLIKVVFVGAPSTGKSTLCQALAKKYQTQWVAEFGRDYWQKHHVNRRLTQEQLIHIAIGQRDWEDQAAQRANQFLFIDTEAIVTRQYALDYYGESTPILDDYAQQSESRYDHFFLCATDIPYEDNHARSGAVHRETFQKRLIVDLSQRGIKYTELRGSLQQRIQQVEAVISSPEFR